MVPRRFPLKRHVRLRRKRKEPRRSSRVRDPGYLQAVAGLPCVLNALDCHGATEAHHMGIRGLGQKASDLTAIPFCTLHHRHWHDCNGVFKGYSKDARADFANHTIADTQMQLGVALADRD